MALFFNGKRVCLLGFEEIERPGALLRDTTSRLVVQMSHLISSTSRNYLRLLYVILFT